jgi:hypothetical protein
MLPDGTRRSFLRNVGRCTLLATLGPACLIALSRVAASEYGYPAAGQAEARELLSQGRQQ